ncbi:hypothetical protein BZG36_04882 [Bifiguratus adelaidae]|uniref:beta-glucosidase n=1 Tax=Bifiguratus adelaidae TaxID=1938954 RepID=A0A261XVM8_9FUNG|nr:hypothetical protein BZG36_04882 [Bifiguratus adelaidae]
MDIGKIVSKLTLEEKVSLLAGKDWWSTVGIPEKGVPSIKTTDGPNGARGGTFSVKSACLPTGVCLGATFNIDLLEQIGKVLAEETRTKNARILLGPTVNIHRTVLAGRNFECYSEDPFLSGKLAAAYVRGLQGEKIAATIKHFVANDQETERMSISSEITERALREIYLMPFYIALKESDPWCLMTSYNKVNGQYASENAHTLHHILRGEWAYDGLVISDWFGTYSTEDAVNAGLDLEMPGPGLWRREKVLKAVQQGRIKEETIDHSVRRLLQVMEKTGWFKDAFDVFSTPERAIDVPEHHEILRNAAAEGMVLLKNNNSILPLDISKIKSIAVIGLSAKKPIYLGGGSSSVRPHYVISPLEAIQEIAAPYNVEVNYAQGAYTHSLIPYLAEDRLITLDGKEEGMMIEFFDNDDLQGEVKATKFYPNSRYKCNAIMPAGIDANHYSCRGTCRFEAPVDGEYTIGLVAAGPANMFVNGKKILSMNKMIIPGAYFTTRENEETVKITLKANMIYTITVEYRVTYRRPAVGFQIGVLEPIDDLIVENAAKVAEKADIALVFTGLNFEWESEGFDRSSMDLSGRQNELIRACAAANSKTIVVNNSGSPITMPWLDEVQGFLQAWFPGQECGHAIADILFGQRDPGGRLPTTFPKRLEDTPAFINFPGENGKVVYGEGLYVGYRYYDKTSTDVLFPFGFGLSYTTYKYSDATVQQQAETADNVSVNVTVNVTNTGSRTGQEVVQVYVHDKLAKLSRPDKELKGFAKIRLNPGETKQVSITLDRMAFGYYDDKTEHFVAEEGDFDIIIARSSKDIVQNLHFTLKKTMQWVY